MAKQMNKASKVKVKPAGVKMKAYVEQVGECVLRWLNAQADLNGGPEGAGAKPLTLGDLNISEYDEVRWEVEVRDIPLVDVWMGYVEIKGESPEAASVVGVFHDGVLRSVTYEFDTNVTIIDPERVGERMMVVIEGDTGEVKDVLAMSDAQMVKGSGAVHRIVNAYCKVEGIENEDADFHVVEGGLNRKYTG